MTNKRKNITIDIDSAEALMQEIYNDLVEQKNTANIIMKKMLNFMKNSEEMSVIGPVIKEQQKIMNDCFKKTLCNFTKDNFFSVQSNGGNKESGGRFNLSDEDKILLDKLLNDNDDKNNDNGVNYVVK